MVDFHAKSLDRYVYDIKKRLKMQLESLKPDLLSGRKAISRPASKKALQILEWLGPPLVVLTDKARLQRARELVDDDKLPHAELREAIRSVVNAPGRHRGRPRSETAQQAILAYPLSLMHPSMTMFEIAKRVRKCNHRDSSPDRSCEPCRDAMRDAVKQLKKFLPSIELDPVKPIV